MNDVSYVNFTSGLPVEWAKEVKLEDDVYINRMEFWDTITDEVEKFIVL